ncbi:MAG: hypothetical protein ACUVWJ_00010 [Spirochaetota bacterium]
MKPIILSFIIFFMYGVIGNVTSSAEEIDRGFLNIRTYYPSDLMPGYEALYLSYRLKYKPVENVTFGVSLLKGSGESGYYPRGYIGDSETGLYEKASFYLLFEDCLKLNKIIAGNYIPLFGQGLLFGGAFPLIFYDPYYDLPRYRDGIYPTSSASKAVLLEGIALEYQLRNVDIRPFISWNWFDCTAGESDYYKYEDNDWDGIPNAMDEDDFTGFEDEFGDRYSCKNHIFSCIRDEPDYEYESDRLKRNKLQEYLLGLNLSSRLDRMKIGGTFYYTEFNRLIDPYYNFDPGEGDKTGSYFRGKNYYGGDIYFKLEKPLEVFGEVAGTLYRRRSYYPEFNGELISSFAFSGGFRRKLGGIGVILWGAYIPPSIVNPHGLELPDGINNIVCGLLGVHRVSGGRRFLHWIYFSKELSSIDYPPLLETQISYNHRIDIPISGKNTLRSKIALELVDHHEYAPESLSLKLSSRYTLSHSISEEVTFQVSIETRSGGPLDDKISSGGGISGEIVRKGENSTAAFTLMGYLTGNDRFAYLYPPERPLDSWSFIPGAIHGVGFSGSAIYVRHLKKDASLGIKIRYLIDLKESATRRYTLYMIGEFPL